MVGGNRGNRKVRESSNAVHIVGVISGQPSSNAPDSTLSMRKCEIRYEDVWTSSRFFEMANISANSEEIRTCFGEGIKRKGNKIFLPIFN